MYRDLSSGLGYGSTPSVYSVGQGDLVSILINHYKPYTYPSYATCVPAY